MSPSHGHFSIRMTWALGLTTSLVGAAKPLEIDSPHYHLRSTAPEARSRQAIEAAERLHLGWTQWCGPKTTTHRATHQLRLFATRDQMRQSIPGLNWAEAIYHDGRCDQFDDRWAERPWHWLVHEATHQLAYEDAHLNLPRWANEGLACLFSTSKTKGTALLLGSVDPETYPVWWLKRTPPGRQMQQDLRSGLLMAPSQILKEPDTIDIGTSVNAHYLTWWSLVHYLNATDPDSWKQWVLTDGTNAGLARRFGPLSTLDSRWYAHVLALRDSLPKH